MKKRRHWAVSEKKRLASQARRLRSDGATFAAICDELDVLEGSLRLWMEQYPDPEIREVYVLALGSQTQAGVGRSPAA